MTALSRVPLGFRYMCLSALGFALMAACVKAVSAHGIPVLEIVAARALVSVAISYVDIKRKRLSPWGTHKGLLTARGVVGSLSLVCVYYAVTTLPLAEATFLQYLHPAFTALLALFFLREKIQFSTLVCIALSIIGLVIMTEPQLILVTHQSLPTLSVVAAVLGAFGSAVAYILVKQLSNKEDSSVIVFYFPLIALPFSLLLLGDNIVMPSAQALWLLLLVGIFTQVGQVGLTKAMQFSDANKATAFSYIQVVFAVLLGWYFFAEVPNLATTLGGALIVIGALINLFWHRTAEQ